MPTQVSFIMLYFLLFRYYVDNPLWKTARLFIPGKKLYSLVCIFFRTCFIITIDCSHKLIQKQKLPHSLFLVTLLFIYYIVFWRIYDTLVCCYTETMTNQYSFSGKKTNFCPITFKKWIRAQMLSYNHCILGNVLMLFMKWHDFKTSHWLA